MQKGDEEPEITIDAESNEEVVIEESEVSANKLQSKIKKLRDELNACKKERAENLEGWQRSKADLVNYKRTVSNEHDREKRRSQAEIVRALIPALDSFESAMTAENWKQVKPEWRGGVERIFSQLHNALEGIGLVVFGTKGEVFDPVLHECMSVIPAEGDSHDNTLAQVLQRGYKLGDEVVRPAKVVVAQHS